MSQRKPPGVSFESWVDRQIREAADAGKFDNLPGAGKPLPELGGRDADNWWLKSYLAREGLPAEAVLPPSLLLRKEIEQLPDTVRGMRTEQEVRDAVQALNKRVIDHLRLPSGPPVPVHLADAEAIVRRWTADRARPEPPAPPLPPPPRARWWRRRERPAR
jgi:hypothetical protein